MLPLQWHALLKGFGVSLQIENATTFCLEPLASRRLPGNGVSG